MWTSATQLEEGKAYNRPFQPYDLRRLVGAEFSLAEMADQLRREPVYAHSSRNALTLVRDGGLAVVLTVAKDHAQCDEHCSHDPILFVVLEGALSIESDSETPSMHLREGHAAVLAREVPHRLTAAADCSYLMVIGSQTPNASSAASDAEEVSELVGRVARRIATAPASERSELRAYARDLLSIEATPAQRESPYASPSPLGIAGIVLLLGFAALVFLFILPPVGAVLAVSALLLGVGTGLAAIAWSGVRLGERWLRLGERWLRRHRSEDRRTDD